MSEKTEISHDMLFKIIGMKEVELCIYREKTVTLAQALQRAETQPEEKNQNDITK